jgi:hypothetical protein
MNPGMSRIGTVQIAPLPPGTACLREPGGNRASGITTDAKMRFSLRKKASSDADFFGVTLGWEGGYRPEAACDDLLVERPFRSG